MRRIILVLLVLLLAGAIVAAYAAWQVGRPYRGWQQPVFVDVRPGTNTRQIARQLHSSGVLAAEWPFLLLHYASPRRTLKAGEYYFDEPVSPRQVIEKLGRGDVYHHSVTVPEGFTIFEVADTLAATGLVQRDDVLAAARDTTLISDLFPGAETLEGFLFPDTYRFLRRTTAREMVQAMVGRFRSVYGDLQTKHPPGRPVHEIVTMASLIEEETRIPEERPLVASVFYNRLTQRMPLQCDPTVIYAALLAGRYRGTIFQSDLSFNSPYNTYLRPGLPPGPIASPGRASLEAAMVPATTDYLYFVSDGQGRHKFSTTFSDHSAAVSEFRRSQQNAR